MAGGKPAQIFQAMLLGPLMSSGGKKMGGVSATMKNRDLMSIKELLEAGKIMACDRSMLPIR